ncbi:UPF0755 protein [Actinopolyspora xinjiangensis]|uniref:Endolytic murein transglycosylase n=1 Tax=Actinopolyspora xinjiangensis TaxID=405564 RepID=A0A1H0TTT4_9ACTN|nr:endolytic transglycosylase MltG [Actinopolyspora xinjiangensis]SDP57165.1 UPF0755 protein [Actinopolyspora xinjiangensis]
MNDDLGLFTDDAGETPRGGRKQERERLQRRRRRRVVTASSGVLVLLIVVGGACYGLLQLLRLGGYEDYEGGGEGQVVIEVQRGDTTSAIATTLSERDVVASAKAFVEAAEDNSEITGIQPGFYLMRAKMSGEAAVRRIVSDEARAGRVEIRGGMQLADHNLPGGKVKKGILTRLAEVTCTGGEESSGCVDGERMTEVATRAPLSELGVPDWAAEGISDVPHPRRRLEGLILPGIYHVEPTAAPVEILRSVLEESFGKMRAVGLSKLASDTGHSRYELIRIASLVQSEGITEDFDKVARVIENRLAIDMRLELDSTINYVLEDPQLYTDDEDRARKGPYNTYDRSGLPPTPISAPSTAAIKAAANPAEGDWKYFVKCHKDGTSCFSETFEQHKKAQQKADRNGV